MQEKLINHIKHIDNHLKALSISRTVPISVQKYIQEHLLNNKHKHILEEVLKFEEDK